MADPKTLCFYDFFQAQLAKHRLEEEGHRAEAYSFVFACSAWGDPWVRLIVFEKGAQIAAESDAGEFQPGALARAIDAVLQTVAMAGMCMVPVWGLYVWSHSEKPLAEENRELVVSLILSLPIVIVGVIGVVACYADYRRRGSAGIVIMQLGGWVAFFCATELGQWLLLELWTRICPFDAHPIYL